MARNSTVPEDSFDEILEWLDSDREVAGAKYVQLRLDIAKIFLWNHSSDPESQTDEVFDIVARRVHELRKTYVGDPRLFFYGVARRLMKEFPKRVKAETSLDGIDIPVPPSPDNETEFLILEECLHSCLQALIEDQRQLILAYYAKEKQPKIQHRTELAQGLGISVETLRVRTYRIRAALEQCIERCLEEHITKNEMSRTKFH